MKVLGISGSPRKGGNTDILLGEALTGAGEAGAETELLAVRDWQITSCDGCDTCAKTGKCHINDDMQVLYDKLLDTNGIIFGTPIYFWSMTGMLKIFIERTVVLQGKLNNKVGGIIVVAERTGVTTTSSMFYVYFAANHMFATDYVHGFAQHKGGIRKDKHAMKAAWELGKQMTLLIKSSPTYPAEYDVPLYRFVSRKYGVPRSPVDQGD